MTAQDFPRIAEYGNPLVKKHFSQVVTLKTGGKYALKHHTAGYELAGSCARYSASEKWSVTFYDVSSNTTHGRSFQNQNEAEALFEKWANL